jgi:hypothetical protein
MLVYAGQPAIGLVLRIRDVYAGMFMQVDVQEDSGIEMAASNNMCQHLTNRQEFFHRSNKTSDL